MPLRPPVAAGAPTVGSATPPRRPVGAARTKRDELALLINSRNPIVAVETSEEQRFLALLEQVAADLQIPLFVWSVTNGLARAGAAGLYNSDQPEQALTNIGTVQGDGIFLLKDFGRYCDNDRISRRLRDLADGFRTARRSIVILGAAIQLPPELAADAVEFVLGLPSAEELSSGVKATLAELNRAQGIPTSLDALHLAQLVKDLAGLAEDEALRVLRRCVLARGK